MVIDGRNQTMTQAASAQLREEAGSYWIASASRPEIIPALPPPRLTNPSNWGWISEIIEVMGSDVRNADPREKTEKSMSNQVPLVDYLSLGEHPHLVANECTNCGARFFDRRNACANCSGTEFKKVDIATDGEVRAFTIVAHAAAGIPTPFVSAVVDCGGTSVRANIINTEPDPDHVSLGMKVRLATYSMGKDASGTEAVGFGFEPAA